MKKLVCLFLALLMAMSAVSVFAESEAYPEHLSLTWLGLRQKNVHPEADSLVGSYIGKEFNVDISPARYDFLSTDDMTTYFASGDMADHFLVREAQVSTVIDQELCRKVPVSMIKEYAPTLWETIMNNFPGLMQTSVYDAETDSLYAFPSGEGEFYATYMIRQDWLDKLGLNMPTNLDEFKEVCRAFREDDPDGNGEKDTYAFALPSEDYGNILPIAYAYNISVPSNAMGRNQISFYLNDEKNGVEKAQITEKYREMLNYVRDLYANDYIYPDMSITHPDARQLASDGKIGIIACSTIDMLALYSPTDWYAMMYEKNPNAKGVTMPYFEGATAEKQSTAWAYHFFGDETSDEKVIRILQIFDRQLTDPEFAKYVWLGEEHVTYEIQENGIAAKTPEYASGEKCAEAGVKYYFANYRSLEMKTLTFGPEYAEQLKYQNFNTYNELVPAGVKFASVLEYGSDLSALELEYYANVIAGNKNTAKDWDTYVQQWYNAGGDKVVTEVYDFYASHN